MADEMNMSVSSFKKFKLVFLGNQSVGKSSIISRYVYDAYEPESNPTIGVDFVVKSIYYGENTYKIHFWDTAGQEKFKSLIPSYIKDCQIAVLVYDVTNLKSFEDIDSWHSSIKNERGDDIILGLLGNKVDLENRVVTTEEGLRKAEKINALFLECSAKTGENLHSFFKILLETLIKNVEDDPEHQDDKKIDGENLGKKVSPSEKNSQRRRCC